jgi:hypothetical protein
MRMIMIGVEHADILCVIPKNPAIMTMKENAGVIFSVSRQVNNESRNTFKWVDENTHFG